MTMIFGKHKNNNDFSFLRLGVIAVFCGIILFTLYSIEANLDTTASLGSLAPQNFLRHPSLRRRPAMTPASISSWMTFEYLNLVFKIPSPYLKNALQITDAHYPRLTIKNFAAGKKISLVIALTEVKATVTAFLANQKIVQ